MRKLIINADDLGYSYKVNTEIENAILLHSITSSTLMANAPGFLQGVEIAKKYTHISVGVHLNLVEFKPLTNHAIFQKHGIIDKEDNFIDGAIFVNKIDEELKQAIFEEWDAQISKIKSYGILPTHIDSHQHTHTIYALRFVLYEILKKHNIRKVRRCASPSIRLMLKESKTPSIKLNKSNSIQPPRKNIILRRINLLINKYKCAQWNRFMKNHFIVPNSFYAFRHFVMYRKILNLGNKESVVELMCHPGQPAFNQETKMLTKNQSWLPKNYILSTYKEV